MKHGPPRRRRARPVADAPIDALLLRTEELAKGWLLALLEQAPLKDASGILVAELTDDGPRICGAAVRALADDNDLRRLEPGGALEQLMSRTGELAGARSAEDVAAAVDALEGVIWSAVRDELGSADVDVVSELAERHALVMGLIRGASLRKVGQGSVGLGSSPPATDAAPRPRPAAVVPPRPAAVVPPRSEPLTPPAPVAVPDPAVAEVPEPRIDVPETPAPAPARQAPTRPGEALWIGAVEDEVTRAQKSDSLLSLLLVELEDAERVRAADAPRDASATFSRFAQALRGIVRRQDILALETESRAWIIARDTGRAGAQAVASRAAQAVREARPWHGARMTVNVGVAVLREDGHDAATLIDSAEQAKFAAAAAGLAVIHEMPPEGNGGEGPRLVS